MWGSHASSPIGQKIIFYQLLSKIFMVSLVYLLTRVTKRYFSYIFSPNTCHLFEHYKHEKDDFSIEPGIIYEQFHVIASKHVFKIAR